eukprot:scaffold221131_cov31-Tisochrysis_lutea.AAC.3
MDKGRDGSSEGSDESHANMEAAASAQAAEELGAIGICVRIRRRFSRSRACRSSVRSSMGVAAFESSTPG